MIEDLPEEFGLIKAKQDSVSKVLDTAVEVISREEHVEDLFIMVKIDGEYVRFSSVLNDSSKMIAFLEIIKHNLLQGMHS